MISPNDWLPGPCRAAATGASFHMAATQVMTQRGLADGVARWFGHEAAPDFVDWPESGRRGGPGHHQTTRQHTFRSITASITRARTRWATHRATARLMPCARH